MDKDEEQLLVNIPSDIKKWLKSYCVKNGVSMKEQIVKILDEFKDANK